MDRDAQRVFYTENAKKVLWFYLELIAKNAGIQLNYENYCEICGIIDNILDATKYIRRIDDYQLKDEAEKILATAVDLLELCAGNFPNVRKDGNTDEFMDYLKELYEKAAAFVDAYRQKHPRARAQEMI